MLQETLAKPHEQSGLYKYRESKHASELKNKVVRPKGIQLNFYQKHTFSKGLWEYQLTKAVEQVV